MIILYVIAYVFAGFVVSAIFNTLEINPKATLEEYLVITLIWPIVAMFIVLVSVWAVVLTGVEWIIRGKQ